MGGIPALEGVHGLVEDEYNRTSHPIEGFPLASLGRLHTRSLFS